MKQGIKQLPSKFQTKKVVILNIFNAITKKLLTFLCAEKRVKFNIIKIIQ